MVKKLEELTRTQKGIVNILPLKKDNPLEINELKQRLEDNGYGIINKEDIRGDLSGLIRYGNVRTIEDHGKMKYYLSNKLGSEKRNQGSLRGSPHPFRDFYRMVGRWFGSIFLIFGFGVLMAQDLSLTGAVISTGKVADITSILAIALMVIGAVLFFKSNK
ncbi:MAG: hypothetical protein AABW50_04830 [Nanoarchaeota archaeon]